MTSKIQYRVTPKELLDELGIKYKVNGKWLGFKLCPVCGGGDNGQDKWTYAIHSIDGNYNCLRNSCDAKGTFWGFMQFNGLNPRDYIKKDGVRYGRGGKKKHFIYGKS